MIDTPVPCRFHGCQWPAAHVSSLMVPHRLWLVVNLVWLMVIDAIKVALYDQLDTNKRRQTVWQRCRNFEYSRLAEQRNGRLLLRG
jgi:hypothetical protein